MQAPSDNAIQQARIDSRVLALGLPDYMPNAETSTLEAGDRVYLVTVEGDYPATVTGTTDQGALGAIEISLDCTPTERMTFHRGVLRKFTILDFLAQ